MSKVAYIKNICSLTSHFVASSFAQHGKSTSLSRLLHRTWQLPPCSFLHTSQPRTDLMEFFDNKKNWGVDEVKVGRSWRMEELRIKSNSDLHKLWFVLLKREEYVVDNGARMQRAVPTLPESRESTRRGGNWQGKICQTAEVNESMTNLEEVVRERNRAYFELETGDSGERPATMVTSGLGLKSFHKMSEHIIPKWMNKKWHERHPFNRRGHAVSSFLKLYREKLFLAKKKASNRRRGHVMMLLKRFPNVDREALKEQYPDVDVKSLQSERKTLGHHESNTA